jgi:O-antigen ligase
MADLFWSRASSHEGIKSISVLALVVSLPFHYHVSSLLILSGTALFLITSIKKRNFHLAELDILSLCFFAFFAMDLLGLLYTDKQNIKYGLSFLEKHHASILIPLVFFGYYVDSQKRSALFRYFCTACLVACLICIIANVLYSLQNYGTFIHPWRFSHLRLAEPIGLTPVYFSLYIGMAIAIITEKLLTDVITVKEKICNISILLIFLAFLIALGARTVTVTLMVMVLLRILAHAKSAKSYKALIIAAVLPIVFIAFILLNPVAKMRFMDMAKSSYENSNYGSYFARWKIWEPGLSVIKDNIWFGVGTGDHQTELNKAFVKYNFAEGVEIFNMHNQYLQTLLSHGIFGLLILVFSLTHQMLKALARQDYLYMSFIFLFSFGCLTESLLNRNKGLIFYLVFSFIFYNHYKTIKD